MKALLKYRWLIWLLAATSSLSVNAQTTTNLSGQQNGSGNWLNYPYGTRLYPNGTISTPRSRAISPSVAVPRGNGSTTYYYPDGTQITVDTNTINPAGTTISPGINGGLRDSNLRNPNNFPYNQQYNQQL